jgi:hypothetical protein
MPLSPDLFGLTDATSNFGAGDAAGAADCARPGVAFISPKEIGAATAATPATDNSSFLPSPSLLATLCVMMRTIRFFKSEPVIPDMQAKGDSR